MNANIVTLMLEKELQSIFDEAQKLAGELPIQKPPSSPIQKKGSNQIEDDIIIGEVPNELRELYLVMQSFGQL
ncbi:MAG: hypothetical protein WC774_00470 [Candidatus Gracilibacteria bacterium]|jgi:hypothetical protein